jgi:mycoredoxin
VDARGVQAVTTRRLEEDAGMPAQFTMYSTPWCGYCHRLKSQLERAGIQFEVVDIERQPEAAQVVEQVNKGNQTVPTLVFPDGTAMTNPSLAQVKAQIGA